MLTEIHLSANVKEIGAGALATNYLADAGNYKIYLVESENPDRYDSKTRLSAITADAQTILMYYVKNSLSHTPTSWEDLLEKKQPAKLPKAIKRK